MSTSTLPASTGPWTPARKLAAAVFILASYAVLAAAALYLAGVLFMGMNRLDPRAVQVTSFVGYWHDYSPWPNLRRKLIASGAISGIGLLVVLPIALALSANPRRPLHGNARFANRMEIAQSGLLLKPNAAPATSRKPNAKAQQPNPPSILVGRHKGQFLALPGQLSVMLSAPTRSGKGVGVVIPNLLHWPDSAVVLDIKGENFDITAGYRVAHGQAVYAFSPFDEEARSHRWNPLLAVRSNPMHRVGDLLTIGQVFFPNDGAGTSSEAFFNDQARNLFMGLGLLLLESPELPRTMGELLRQSSGKGRSLKDHLSATITQRQQDGKPLTDECAEALQRLLSNSENTLSSIVATFNAPLTLFADAVVDAATSASDFDLADVRRQRMSIYVRIPPNRLASARPLLCLFFSQLINLNTRSLPEQDPTLTVQCLLVNDEFTAMGRVNAITHSAAFLAGYNLRLLTVVQAMSQLDAVYGDREARTFATNHGLQILYAPREQRDADEYSAMLGHFTTRSVSRGRSRPLGGKGSSSISQNESDQRRALLLPQEFKELGSERLVLICENCKPILGDKIRYHRDPIFQRRLLPPPAVPAIDMDLHLARVQQRWQIAPDELPPGTTLSIEALAHDFSQLPDTFEGSAEETATVLLNFFGAGDDAAHPSTKGGAIEEVTDEEAATATGAPAPIGAADNIVRPAPKPRKRSVRPRAASRQALTANPQRQKTRRPPAPTSL